MPGLRSWCTLAPPVNFHRRDPTYPDRKGGLAAPLSGPIAIAKGRRPAEREARSQRREAERVLLASACLRTTGTE